MRTIFAAALILSLVPAARADLLSGSGDCGATLAMSPALVAGAGMKTTVWAVPSGHKLWSVPRDATALAFSADGNYLAAFSMDEGRYSARLYDAATGRLLAESRGPAGTRMSFSDAFRAAKARPVFKDFTFLELAREAAAGPYRAKQVPGGIVLSGPGVAANSPPEAPAPAPAPAAARTVSAPAAPSGPSAEEAAARHPLVSMPFDLRGAMAVSRDETILAVDQGFAGIVLYSLPGLQPLRKLPQKERNIFLMFSNDKSAVLAGRRLDDRKWEVRVSDAETGKELKRKKFKDGGFDFVPRQMEEAVGLEAGVNYERSSEYGTLSRAGVRSSYDNSVLTLWRGQRPIWKAQVENLNRSYLQLTRSARYFFADTNKGAFMLDLAAVEGASRPETAVDDELEAGVWADMARREPPHIAAAYLGRARELVPTNERIRKEHEAALAAADEVAEGNIRANARRIAAETPSSSGSQQPTVRFASDLHQEAMRAVYQGRAQSELNFRGSVSDDTRRGLNQYR